MRHGFTTGSCAAAAAKAAAYMLLSGRKKEKISIETPGGIIFNTDLSDIRLSEREASCAVKKDAGDDPDITDGTFIYAAVTYINNIGEKSDHTKDKAVSIDSGKENDRVVIKGGRGVGRVTKPGLDQPVGEAAINHVPREMIIREVTEVMQLLDYSGRLQVEVSVPQGEVLAKKTFNPRLGIVGGISILGTTGIVEPMSEKALVDTIRVELSVHYC
ncbi:MAG: cobalt-precorrin-5B (C(1))-methyltransferase, partial [Eubacterium sp.]|nr:cobalt-precorrin-5B (C(1))-methyltransferase [Eubacterium sp.]